MASRRACSIGWPPQLIEPRLGGMSPIARCRRLVLPEPLGPSRTVGGPEAMASDRSLRIATGSAASETCENTIGRSLWSGSLVIFDHANPRHCHVAAFLLTEFTVAGKTSVRQAVWTARR